MESKRTVFLNSIFFRALQLGEGLKRKWYTFVVLITKILLTFHQLYKLKFYMKDSKKILKIGLKHENLCVKYDF